MSSEMRYLTMLIFFGFIALFPAIFNYIVDPFQYFRQSAYTPLKFIKHWKRMQIPGIIDNYIDKNSVFDSFVIGASLAQNYEADKLGSILESDKKSIVLSFSGAAPSEQAFVAKDALDTGNIKSVLWSMAPSWTIGLDFKNPNHTFPYYLYNDNTVDDINYLYSYEALRVSIGYILAQTPLKKYFRTYREVGIADVRILPWYKYGAWAPFTERQMERVNKRMFSKRIANKETRKLSKTEKETVNGIRKIVEFEDLSEDAYKPEFTVLKDFLETYPSVNFTIVLPPVSALFYHTAPKNMMENAVHRGRAFVEFAKDYPNMRIFGFPQKEIISDLRNYKDHVHFDRNVYRFMTKQMEKGANELTPENVETYTSELLNTINDFDRKNPFSVPETLRAIDFEGNLIE